MSICEYLITLIFQPEAEHFSKPSYLKKYSQLVSQFDTLRQPEYRTLEISEVKQSDPSYMRAKSDDRKDKSKHRKSKKRKYEHRSNNISTHKQR